MLGGRSRSQGLGGVDPWSWRGRVVAVRVMIWEGVGKGKKLGPLK